jgi:hypothetical protein
MENETSKQTWETPVFTVLSINNETLGNGGAGFDFASEVS